MRSLYVGILLAMAGTLSLSLVVFLAISGQIERATVYRTFERTDELQLEEARKALDHGGPTAVSAYMQRANRIFGGSHYLLNSAGVDVVSGQRSIKPDPWRRSGRRTPTPARRSGHKPQSSGRRILVHRRVTNSVSPLGVLPLLPAGDRSYGSSLLGCGGLAGIADPQSDSSGGAVRSRRPLCPLAHPAT